VLEVWSGYPSSAGHRTDLPLVYTVSVDQALQPLHVLVRVGSNLVGELLAYGRFVTGGCFSFSFLSSIPCACCACLDGSRISTELFGGSFVVASGLLDGFARSGFLALAILVLRIIHLIFPFRACLRCSIFKGNGSGVGEDNGAGITGFVSATTGAIGKSARRTSLSCLPI
jgi:hypothetical protein